MHASKGLEFPVVALAGAWQMPEEGEDVQDEARLFYVAATRATQRLVVGMSGEGRSGKRWLNKRPDRIADAKERLAAARC